MSNVLNHTATKLLALVAFFAASFGVASAQTIEDVVDNVVASTTQTVTDVLVTNLPVIFTIFAALVGLGIALHFIFRLIGRRA